MMKKVFLVLASIAVVGSALSAVFLLPNSDETAMDTIVTTETTETTVPADVDTKEKVSASPGRYTSYGDSLVSEDGYSTTILFFYAAWCPECRGFKSAITTSNIPDGVQILEVDYDNEHDLRAKYGATIQTTFVLVDSNGVEIRKWIGYGKDKSLDRVLKELSTS